MVATIPQDVHDVRNVHRPASVLMRVFVHREHRDLPTGVGVPVALMVVIFGFCS